MIELLPANQAPTTVMTAGFNTLLFDGAPGSSSVASTVPANPRSAGIALQGNRKSFSFFDRRSAFKEIPPKFSAAYREMLEFKSLPEGWDGAGSSRISDECINAALAFLALLPADVPAPDPSASGDGTVDWYWRKGSFAATVTFYSSQRAAYFALTGAGSAKDEFKLGDSVPRGLVEGLRAL
ncbi:hypothetical protein ACGYLV_10250 [Sulfitobacter sp. M21595]|uniref:hypothetical protein n=1 Tax=Sulfitobacter sp. M21595 TaxID=3368574 RepID=UPI003746310F